MNAPGRALTESGLSAGLPSRDPNPWFADQRWRKANEYRLI